jgi:hypothetical protein
MKCMIMSTFQCTIKMGNQRLGLTVTGVHEASGLLWCVVNLDLSS